MLGQLFYAEPVLGSAVVSVGGQTALERKGWPVKRLLLVLGCATTAYALALLLWGDGRHVSLAVLWSATGLQAAGLCLASYLLRGLRWKLWMAHFGRTFGWPEGLRLYLAGYAFTPTPGNVGEAMRGMMLARQPLPLLQSLAIFGAERLADLFCFLLLCLPALGWLMRGISVQSLAGWQMGLGLSVLVAGFAAALVLWRIRQRLLQHFDWLQGAWACLAVRPLVWFALTLTAWAAQGLAVWLVCGALNVQIPVLTAIGFYAVAMVSGALSALPAGLGGMELVFGGLLVAHGASTAQALTITVVVRLLTLWLAVAIGVAALTYSAVVRKDIRF